MSEYTERFCQSAVIYSGIVDDPESVLEDKGPLVHIWSDGLVAEYRKALPFLDLTWSNRTLRSNLDRLATWERDADVKAKVRVAAATFNTTKQDNRWSKRESKCKYCGKLGHWERECRKKLQDSKRNAMHNSAPSQPAHNPEVVPPVTTETVGLVTDFIPRWGLPDCIDSDQGTHFTGQVVKEVSRMLKIKWNLHCPYRPQASGQVERSNRTIKTRLSKMHQEGVPWVEALPAVLCSMRASPNRSVGLSPHEIITGRPMQMPGVIDLRNADVHIASDALIAYCENLTKAVQSAKERVESCWQTPPEGGHTIIPGQWVMIKAFRNKPLEPKWYGPHQVMLITAAAVLCQGRKTWTHVSHCKVVPPPAGIG